MKLNYKYKLSPKDNQELLIFSQIFFYNQAWNIMVNELNAYDDYHKNCLIENIEPAKGKSDTEFDNIIKNNLKERKLDGFKVAVLQYARIQAKTAHFALKALRKTAPERFAGRLKFKKSNNMNGQGFRLATNQFSLINNGKKSFLKLFREEIPLTMHREIPQGFRITSVAINFKNNHFYATFSITNEPIKEKRFSKDEYKELIANFPKLEDIEKELDINQEEFLDTVMGMDLNINSIDLGNKEKHIQINTKNFKNLSIFKKKAKRYKKLKDKQARRQKKAAETNSKLTKNFYKDQARINVYYRKERNIKSDYIHKLSWKIIRNLQENGVKHFFLEDLDVLKMISRENVVKLLGVRKSRAMRVNIQKRGFGEIPYQIIFKLFKLYAQNPSEDRIYVSKVNPRNTSKRCSECGNIKKDLTLKDRTYKCECGLEIARDWNACINICSVW